MKYNVLVVFAALSIAACDTKRENDSTALSKDQTNVEFRTVSQGNHDAEFAAKITDGGMTEVKLGELALKNASSADVKKFAQTMINDHTKAGNELKALAQKKNYTVPATISEMHQKKYDELSAMKGADFDKAYTSLMVKDHKEVVDAMKSEISKGTDSDMKAWATKTLPAIEHHLMMAQQMDKSVSYK